MSEKAYVTLTKEEKSALTEALEADFGQHRISQGAYIKMLAEERTNE